MNSDNGTYNGIDHSGACEASGGACDQSQMDSLAEAPRLGGAYEQQIGAAKKRSKRRRSRRNKRKGAKKTLKGGRKRRIKAYKKTLGRKKTRTRRNRK